MRLLPAPSTTIIIILLESPNRTKHACNACVPISPQNAADDPKIPLHRTVTLATYGIVISVQEVTASCSAVVTRCVRAKLFSFGKGPQPLSPSCMPTDRRAREGCQWSATQRCYSTGAFSPGLQEASGSLGGVPTCFSTETEGYLSGSCGEEHAPFVIPSCGRVVRFQVAIGHSPGEFCVAN